jgi:N-formylglutamate amidohydrolase
VWKIDYKLSNLVASHRGTLPVLIACPHGGETEPPGLLPRKRNDVPAECDFNDQGDEKTREIAEGVAQRALEIYGEAPYVVIADWHRKFVDANRRRDCAFKAAGAAPLYDEYHATVRAFVDDIRAENGGLGLLFDIHGTAGINGDPAKVFLGTADGETVARLLAADSMALFRRRSLRSYLEAAGYPVSPPQPGVPEVPSLRGGFTVSTYGSSHADGLDAVQLEITRPLRIDDGERSKLIEVLAYAFGNLVERWADSHTLTTAATARVAQSSR